MTVYEKPVSAHLTLDPEWDRLSVIEFGSVWDGQPDEFSGRLSSDERVIFLFGGPGGPVIGFMVHQPHDFDPEEFEDRELWERPRFAVPLLGLADASIGEIVLAVQGRFEPGEPTNDAMFFHMAIDASHLEKDLPKAAWCWRMALEAGDLKARLALGYSLVELGEFRQAYEHLRLYAELTPHNAWAWCWLGRACEGLGETSEASSAYRRAVELEADGGFETDAPELLARLTGGSG
jgi:hypothetical protein